MKEEKVKMKKMNTKKKSAIKNTKEKTNDNASAENGKNKKIIIIIGISIIISLLLIFIFIFNSGTDCHKIAKKISKYLEETTIVDKGADDEYKFSYIESELIYTNELGNKEEGNYAIAIAKYNSSNEAEIKAKYLKNLYIMLHKKIDGTLLEQVDDMKSYFNGEDDLIFTNGTYLIRISSYYKERHDELKKEINNILKKYNTNNN